MRKKQLMNKLAFLCAGFSLLGLGVSRGNAAVITVSDSAPTSSALSNPYNSGNVGSPDGYKDYSNNGTSGGSPTLHGGVGETFTIPAGGLTINSITVKTTSGAGANSGNSIGASHWWIDVAAVSNNNAVQPGYTSYDGGATYQPTKLISADDEAASGASAIQNDFNNGDVTEYITYTLANPVVLAGGSQTGYDFSILTDSSVYVPFAVTAGNAYTGGSDLVVNYTSYNDGTSSLGANSVDPSNNDKVFYINASFAPVPEPGTMGVLASGASLLALRRRRRA